MAPSSIINNNFTSRELSILQKLYRSRDFKNKIVSKTVTPLSYTFLVYGSMNTLSAIQRRAFRNHVSKGTQFSNINVKLTLFSSTVAQYVRGFSSLQKLDSLLKGTTYQRVITVTNCSESVAYSQFLAFFEYLTSLKFTDEMSFNFIPSFIFVSINHTQGVAAPRRFYHRHKIVSSNTLSADLVLTSIIHTIQSVYSKVILVASF